MCPLGPAYDLTFCEVRDHSLVVEWQKPVYTGSGPITGYHVEYAKTGTSDWHTATEKAVHHRFYKVIALLKLFLFTSNHYLCRHQTFVTKCNKPIQQNYGTSCTEHLTSSN